MVKRLTLEEFRQQCSKYIEDELGIVDLLAEDDPYEVHEQMREAYETRRLPIDVMDELFEEDFARRAGDEEDLRLSMEQE